MLADVDRVLALDPAARAPELAAHLASWQDGWLKLLVTAAGLRLRRDHPELFLSGGYMPLVTETYRTARRWSPSCACTATRPRCSSRRASPPRSWTRRIPSRSAREPLEDLAHPAAAGAGRAEVPGPPHRCRDHARRHRQPGMDVCGPAVRHAAGGGGYGGIGFYGSMVRGVRQVRVPRVLRVRGFLERDGDSCRAQFSCPKP